MLSLTRQTDYAVQLLATLSDLPPGRTLSLRLFSRTTHISFPFLQRIAYRLRQAGIIEGIKGSSGGYRLMGDPKKLNVQEVVEALEGPVELTLCISNPGACLFESHCKTKKAIGKMNHRIAQLLRSTTIADLV